MLGVAERERSQVHHPSPRPGLLQPLLAGAARQGGCPAELQPLPPPQPGGGACGGPSGGALVL